MNARYCATVIGTRAIQKGAQDDIRAGFISLPPADPVASAAHIAPVGDGRPAQTMIAKAFVTIPDCGAPFRRRHGNDQVAGWRIAGGMLDRATALIVR
jgi:hypothetical protein